MQSYFKCLILLIFILPRITAEVKLFKAQLDGVIDTAKVSFSDSQVSAWSIMPPLPNIFFCSRGITQFTTGGSFGQLGRDYDPIQLYTGIPPHCNVRVELKMKFSGNWGPSDKVIITVDGSIIYSTSKPLNYCSVQNCGSNIQGYDQISVNLTHSVNTLNLKLGSVIAGTVVTTWFQFRELQIYYDECYKTCEVCSGPNQDQCTSCPVHATLISGKCSCKIGLYLYDHQCIPICPSFYQTDITTNECLLDCYVTALSFCANCKNSVICITCLSTPQKYLYKGACIDSCPNDSELVGSECVPLELRANLVGNIIMRAFDKPYYGKLEMMNSGFTSTFTTGPGPFLFSDCGGKRIYGGLYSVGGILLEKTFTLLPAHYKARVLLQVYHIDTWDAQSFSLYIDNILISQTKSTVNVSPHTNFICGVSDYTDLIYNLDFNVVHNSPTLYLKMVSNLNQDPCNESFGISDFFLILDQCYQYCISCDDFGCLECIVGAYLHIQTKKCFLVCPDGLYGAFDIVSGKNICLDCSLRCQTCVTSASTCLTCAGNRVIDPPFCSCPVGMYDPTPYYANCFACLTQCETCANFDFNCLTCAANRVFTLPNQCLCPPNTYQTNLPACSTCSNFCAVCTSHGINFCDICAGNRVLSAIGSGICICPTGTVTDPTGYFNDGTSARCPRCNYQCETCISDVNTCFSCIYNRISPALGCICPDQSYDDGTLPCQPCNKKCQTCAVTADSCLTCQYDRSGVNCDCADSYYDAGIIACQLCNIQCKTCQYNADNCIVCAADRVNPPLCICGNHSFDNGKVAQCQECSNTCASCVSSAENCLTCFGNRQGPPYCFCSQGTYESGGSLCLDCIFKCAKCETTAANCIVCAGNRMNPPDCICPDGTYEDNNSSTCPNCNVKCGQCRGPGLADCILSCTGNRINPPFCDCPPGFYDNGNAICPSCIYKCNKCEYSAINCTQCIDIRSPSPACGCPEGFYDDGFSPSCIQCNIKCKLCDKGESNCVTCAANRINSPTCTCPVSFYDSSPSTNNPECLPCDFQCIECYNGNQSVCKRCRGNRLLAPICNCPEGHYDDYKSDTCPDCYRTCTKCTGQTGMQCYQCIPTFILSNQACICQDGKFDDPGPNKCIPCSSTCKTCEGISENSCLSCSIEKFRELVNGICKCITGYTNYLSDNGIYLCIESTKLQAAIKCYEQCEICIDTKTCQQCQGNMDISKLGSCVCSPGLWDPDGKFLCNNHCHITCKHCKGTAENMCTECYENAYFESGKCSPHVVESTQDALLITVACLLTVTILLWLPYAYNAEFKQRILMDKKIESVSQNQKKKHRSKENPYSKITVQSID